MQTRRFKRLVAGCPLWKLVTGMSEFKFACPVCGQHMAADSASTGMQIECPTCFQAIIVPRAPNSQSKYLLSATQAIKPQPSKPFPPQPIPVPARARNRRVPVLAVILGTLGISALAFFLLSGEFVWNTRQNAEPANGGNGLWNLDLSGAKIPERPARGRMRGEPFVCDHASFQRGMLALRSGTGSNSVVLTISFFLRDAGRPNERSLDIATNQPGSPRVTLHWIENGLPMTQTFMGGYAMKLDLGNPGSGSLPFGIYLCLPDARHSLVAGRFNADIRNPPPPRGRPGRGFFN